MFLLQNLANLAKTDRTAIVYNGETLSFAALERQSGAFAAYLLKTLGEDRTPILIYGHKELAIPACMFGALKAGRGYIPVDTSFPPERVRQIAEEVRPKLIVDLYGIGLEAQTVLDAEALRNILNGPDGVGPEAWVGPEDIAYILFTSGSTGKPKGVQITAGNLAAFMDGVAPWFDLGLDGGVFLNEISYSFDVSVCALYYALSRGMTLYTVDKHTLDDPRRLFAALRASDIDFWVSTPSLAEICVQSEQFCRDLLPRVKGFVFCGEVLTKKLAAQILERFPGVPVYNAYGPTEATVLVTAAEVTPAMLADSRPIPIGYAFRNVQARIVDPAGQPLPDGEAGELLLVGSSVSPGYFRRPALNEKAFFADAATGQRGYHTGDLCFEEQGLIYYCGRLDGQVKLNGFRVELEDVENNLVKVENIARAAVLPVWTDGKVTSLEAFVLLETPDGLKSLQRTKKIKAALAGVLPSYMIPRKITAVESFPLNTNGKVDKKALAAKL